MVKDSKYIDLESTLNAIGKKVFVDFYYDFKDSKMSADELAKKLYRENPLTKSTRQGFRIPRARHIFEMNQQIDALSIIIYNSSRLSPDTIKRAEQILKNEISERELIAENEETKFIHLVNLEVAKNNDKPIAYRNTPKKPKYETRSSVQPVRDIKTSRNALSLANYECEFDNSHYLFKRKNCAINYTEPHHLIPLSAQRDFPEISLDCEQNIVSLCCNCHKQVHYGADTDSILKPLYERRKSLLKEIGIDISYNELKRYY